MVEQIIFFALFLPICFVTLAVNYTTDKANQSMTRYMDSSEELLIEYRAHIADGNVIIERQREAIDAYRTLLTEDLARLCEVAARFERQEANRGDADSGS